MHTEALKQLAEQLEFRREVLRVGLIVNNQHRAPGRITALVAPLRAEHVEQGLFQVVSRGLGRKSPVHLFAARLLGP